MSAPDVEPGQRRATNVTLPAALVAEARARGINVSQACEAGLRAAVAERRRAQWLAENREAIEAYNRRIENDGLTLAAYRPF
jgi:antitoxin CcdA